MPSRMSPTYSGSRLAIAVWSTRRGWIWLNGWRCWCVQQLVKVSLRLPKTCCRWLGQREAMGLMLLDLGCRVVDEETAEDPTKPAIQIFEKQRKPQVTQNRRLANNALRSGDTDSVPGVVSQTAAQKQKPHLQGLAARIRRRPNMWRS